MNKNIFKSRTEVKWCPGCGNYSILMSMQKALYSIGIPNNNIVFISGIGCSGRFPYYMNTHGFHTLHGRAPPVAIGFKIIQSKCSVWIVVGDGDGFSIGLSHLLHMFRRNVNVNVLFINNKVYGLTKGQYSPTSDKNMITSSSPFGSLETSINPVLLALSSGCTFVARAIDIDTEKLQELIVKAMEHKGTSFIEVLQNCKVYNDGAYSVFSDKSINSDRILYLHDRSHFIFGKNNDKVLCVDNSLNLQVLNYRINKDKCFLVHDISSENVIQLLLARLLYTDIPFPLGIFRSVSKETYDDKCLKLRGIKVDNINKLFADF